MSVLNLATAEVFEPLLHPARYKGAYGGRGSGKSHFFAELMVEDSIAEPGVSGEGLRSVCIREVQKDLTQSAKLLIEDKLSANRLGDADGFKVFRDVIQTPKDGIIIFKGMQDYTAESVKSLEKFKRAWWEEAQAATARSLELLRPTIREEGSEIWASWNPRFDTDPIDMMFRGPQPPTGAVVVRANWVDNPWFPKVLEQERIDCFQSNPDQYRHIWEGDYVSVVEGAYFARDLSLAKTQNRIGNVAADPLMPIKAFWDIGVSDATAIWVAQFIGREIRVLDYYEAENQPLAAHLAWLRSRNYEGAKCYLPHDGAHRDQVYAVRFEDHIKAAGFKTEVVKNQGRAADMQRIEAARRVFPAIWFHEPTTRNGLKALGWYHEKRDQTRRMGLGPEHDWSSHGADAFGLMCVCYEAPKKAEAERSYGGGSGGWMG